jgi:hypothetical protein
MYLPPPPSLGHEEAEGRLKRKRGVTVRYKKSREDKEIPLIRPSQSPYW